jgi:hypothetical protein
MDINSYDKLASLNPYILPGLKTDDTRYKIIGYGGLKGQIGKDAGYRLDISFNSIENALFFVNDTNNNLQNHFIAAEDNIDLVKFKGELWYSPFTFLDFYLGGQYNSFTMSTQEQPWHTPVFNFRFGASYNFKEKIYAKFNLNQEGKRYAMDWSNRDLPIELDPIWDLNLGLEYKYNNVLSIFADFNNLLSKTYYVWNQYPTQKLNVLAGFSYKF